MKTAGSSALPPLLFRPAVRIGEGPRAYSRRLADENRLSLRWLERNGFRFDSAVLRAMGCATPTGANEVLDAYLEAVSASSIRFPGSWLRRLSRFCPACVRENDLWRVDWELRFADACSIHGLWLIDHCDCGVALDWHRRSMLTCPHGHLLREARSAQCPRALCSLSGQIASRALKQPGRDRSGEFGNFDLGQYQQLVLLLGSFGVPDPHAPARRMNRINVLSASWPISCTAAEIVAGWPAAFEHVLRSRQDAARGSTREGQLEGTFGKLYSKLYRGRPNVFGELRRVFESFVTSNWTGGLGRRNRRLAPKTVREALWRPVGSMARRCPSSARTSVLSKSEGVLIVRRRTAGGRTYCVVKADWNSADAERKLSLSETAKYLGLSETRARAAALAQILPARRTGGFNSPWQISLKHLAAILQKGARVPVLPEVPPQAVALGHALKFWRLSDAVALAVLRAVIGGQMAVVGRISQRRGLAGWLVSSSDIRRLQLAAFVDQGSEHIALPAAARMLGIKDEVMYLLARRGVVDVHYCSFGAKRACGAVTPGALEKFNQRFILGRDLAAQACISPRALIKELDRYLVSPISGPGVDGGRQAVFKRGPALDAAMAEIIRRAPTSESATSRDQCRQIDP